MQFPEFIRIATLPEETIGAVHNNFARVLSHQLGFSFKFVSPKDGQFGSLLPDGNWSGLVGMLIHDEADLITCGLSITEERAQVIDFSFPYFMDRLVFVTRNLEKSVDGESFLRPFTLGVWLCLCACVLFLPVVYSVLFQRQRLIFGILNAFRSLMWKSTSAPEGPGEGFLRGSWAICETLLRWSYIAVLLSVLTVPSLSGVRNIPELANAIREGKYMCTAYPGAFYADALLHSDDANFRIIGESLKENKGYHYFMTPLSDPELTLMPAYIGTEVSFMGSANIFFVSKDEFFLDYAAVGIRKDFCCKAQLDLFIHNLWSSGIYAKFLGDFLRDQDNAIFDKFSGFDAEKHVSSLPLVDFQGVFLLLVVGYALATAVFFIEFFGKPPVKR